MAERPSAGTSGRPTASVVICAYTARRFTALQLAVAAAREQLQIGDELLVVIDHNQELLELAHSTFCESEDSSTRAPVRVVANQGLRGLSGARNTGSSLAIGELVVFLDDDAVPQPGWLASLTQPFADPEVIGTGGVASPAWEQGRPDWLPEEFLWVVGCSYRGLPPHAREIRNPIGANMAFRRTVIHSVGGFTDGIGRVGHTPLGCEETELSIRATRATGGRIVHQPDAAVAHLVTAERSRLGYFFRRCWAEGISKAVVAWLTGEDAALASERSYTTRTLPAGVLAGVAHGIGGDPGGFKRALVILAGLSVTVAGYVRGSLSRVGPAAREPHRPSPLEQAFTPMWSGELELAAPSLPERLLDAEGVAFERARVLVRMEGTPLGFLEFESPDGRATADHVLQLAQDALGDAAAAARDNIARTRAKTRRISVVLCTRNRAQGARRTLDSLTGLSHADVEIIVVDNAPDDDTTREMAAELSARDPRVRYVREPRRGLSRARNRGLREARGEIIAFTDDDVTVDPLWIDGLLRGFDRDEDVACVTGLVASASLSRPAEQYFDRRVWWSSSCEHRLFTGLRGPDDPPLHPYTAGTFGTGANFAVRAATLRSLGGFDPCLGAGSATEGGEDLDLFVRLIRAGHSISYEPSALVWHEHRVDDDSLRSQMYAYGLGLTAYLTKHLLARSSRGALLRRAPGAVWHARRLMRRSRDAASEASLERGGLTAVELRGMLAGPGAYLRARWHERGLRV